MENPLDVLLTRADWRALPQAEQVKTLDGVPWATHEAFICFGPMVIRAFQLSDGRRVVQADDFLELMNSFLPIEDPDWKGDN